VSKRKESLNLTQQNACQLCDDFLPMIKHGDKSFSDLASMINRERSRDPFLAAALTFLRFDKQTTQIDPKQLTLLIDGQSLCIDKDQPNSLNLNQSLQTTHTDLDTLFNSWQWMDETHKKKRDVFSYILNVYLQCMLHQSFLPETLAHNLRTRKIAKTFTPPIFSWDDSDALLIEYDTCPNKCYRDLYARSLRITGNDMTVTLYGGLSYRLHHHSTADDYRQLKQQLIAKLTPWIDRRNDKFICAGVFVLMAAAGAISLGLLLPDLNTLTVGLLATAIAVTTLAASTLGGLGIRAHKLFLKENPNTEAFKNQPLLE